MRKHMKFIRKRSTSWGNRENPWLIFGQIAGCILSIFIAGGAIFVAFLYAEITTDLPSINALPSLLDPPNGLLLQPTRIYDRSGEFVLLTLVNPLVGDRRYLHHPGLITADSATAEEAFLPENMVNATIASMQSYTGESEFPHLPLWQASKYIPLAEHLASEILMKSSTTGWKQDLREGMLAAQILAEYGPEKVGEWYLNYVNFGYMAYGVEAGSRIYFGKEVDQLSFSETALLAAIAENQNLDIRNQPGKFLKRQREIIQAAVVARIISPEEGLQAIQEIPVITLPANQQADDIHYSLSQPINRTAADFSLEQLTHTLSPALLKRGGLKVISTLDYDLQTQVDCARKIQTNRLNAIDPALPPGYPIDCQINQLLSTSTTQAPQTHGPYSVEALILDPTNGQILAMSTDSNSKSTDISFTEFQLPKHQIGTLGNLFVYLTSFSRGQGPASLVWDIPINDMVNPQPSEDIFHGPARERIALVNDYPVAAESILKQVGTENVWFLARQFGIKYPESYSISDLGVNSLFRPFNILELSQAIGILSSQGSLAGQPVPQMRTSFKSESANSELHPSAILKIIDMDGSTLLDWSKPHSKSILSPPFAYLMTNVLSDQTARWESFGHPNSLEIGRPAAVKFGKTTDGQSNWVIGYSKRQLYAVWIGRDEPDQVLSQNDHIILRDAATGLWNAIARYASQDLPNEDFSRPDGIIVAQVCDPSGLLPTAACPNVVEEVFLEGHEPVQLDTLYRLASIDRSTGNLASVFTPPDQVEQRLYFAAPKEAIQWMVKSGLEAPPETFDPLPNPYSDSDEVGIFSPVSFQFLRGQVPILGTAAGSNLSFFRIQYGKGINPEKWILLGNDFSKPVENGELIEWNTAGLDGLYVLQLLVVDRDRSVKRSTVLVVIDNQAPQVQINKPTNGELLTIDHRKKIVMQTQISDNLAVDKVIFEVDGKPFIELKEPPYAISWQMTSGDHLLRVIAWDKAGNNSETSVRFQVE